MGKVKNNRDRWMGRCLIEVPFFWALCLSEEALHEELRMLKVPRDSWPTDWVMRGKDGTCHWLDKPDGGECMMICMRGTEKHAPIEVAALLVHEAVHAWQHIREHMDEAAPSSEFEAWAIQRLSLNLMDAYAKTLACN